MPKHQDLRGPRAPRRNPPASAPADGVETPAGPQPRRFVVHRHGGARPHDSLRLEIAGRFHSWALPQGLPLVSAAGEFTKKPAFQTADLPLDDFDREGMLPVGRHGAAATIVWDRGLFVALDDAVDGLASGKLLFELRGYKLRGLWTLFRIRQPPEWLLMKKPDGWAPEHGYAQVVEATAAAPREESILSGLTVGELATGGRGVAEVRRRLAAAKVPRRPVDAAAVKPMQAKAAAEPFSDPGWLFELDHDGRRLIAGSAAASIGASETAPGAEPAPRAHLAAPDLPPGGRAAGEVFVELARALAALPFTAVMDGEAAVLDDDGRPDVARLRWRERLAAGEESERAALAHPATLYLFDLLAFEGWDLRSLPLAERKALLALLLPPVGPLRFADDVRGAGEALFAEIERRGLAGMLARRLDSPYRGGPSARWLAIRARR